MRIGQSTGTTGTPTLTVLTRHDLWLEYESAARNWWRNGWRPGQVVTHCHPAYMYGGGALLGGSIEYFGALNMWVSPPDTDELAEQAIHTWERIHPDVQMVALSQHRFMEVAAKLGLDLVADCGFPAFSMGGFGRGLLPLMTAGFECYAYLGGPDRTCDGAHLHEDWAIIQAIDPATGRDVAPGQWGNLVVTTLDRDNGLLRYDLEEAAMIEGPADCPQGETSRMGYWGGRFKDLLSSQGVHFQVSDLEKAVASVAELTTPTLEFVVVNPQGSSRAPGGPGRGGSRPGPRGRRAQGRVGCPGGRGGGPGAGHPGRGRRGRPRDAGPLGLQAQAGGGRLMGALEGKTAIVTGAGRGIGREEARLLAAEGATVTVNDVDGDAAAAVVAEIEAAGGTGVANTDDVSTWAGAEAIVASVVDSTGGPGSGHLDILVNNAGILARRHELLHDRGAVGRRDPRPPQGPLRPGPLRRHPLAGAVQGRRGRAWRAASSTRPASRASTAWPARPTTPPPRPASQP